MKPMTDHASIVRDGLISAAAIMRGLQGDVAHHTDLSPEIEGCERAIAALYALVAERDEARRDADAVHETATIRAATLQRAHGLERQAAEADVAQLHNALEALNSLRSAVVATQNAGWSNTIYPFVAILNAAGMEQFDPSEDQIRQHVDCYGGAGGYPGHALREPSPGWCAPVGRLQHLERVARKFLADPTYENLGYLEKALDV